MTAFAYKGNANNAFSHNQLLELFSSYSPKKIIPPPQLFDGEPSYATRPFYIPRDLIERTLQRLRRNGFIEKTGAHIPHYKITPQGLQEANSDESQGIVTAVMKQSSASKKSARKPLQRILERQKTDDPEIIEALALHALFIAHELDLGATVLKRLNVNGDGTASGVIQEARLIDTMTTNNNRMFNIFRTLEREFREIFFRTKIGGKHYYCDKQETEGVIKSLEESGLIIKNGYSYESRTERNSKLSCYAITDMGRERLEALKSHLALESVAGPASMAL